MGTQLPLPNALVIVIREDKRWAFYGYTDENGRIEITLPPGKYDIFVVKEGFYIHQQVEVISADKVKTITMKQIPAKVIVYPYVELAYEHPYEVLTLAYFVLSFYPEKFQENKAFLFRVLYLELFEGKNEQIGFLQKASITGMVELVDPFTSIPYFTDATTYVAIEQT